MKKFLLAGMVAMATMSVFAQTYKPALKLEAGKKYNVTVVSKATNTQEAMGQKMEVPMENNNYQLVEIQSATDKGYKAAATIKRIVFSTNMMGQDMAYDSDKKADRDGKLGESFNKQVNKTVAFEVANNGKIIEGSVVKPKEEESAEGDMMATMLKSMGMSDNATPIFDLFSDDKEMKVGDTFTETKNIATDKSEGKNVTVYTLTGIKDGVATFTFAGTGNLEMKLSMQGMDMVNTTNNKTSGEMLVDMTTGMLIKKTITNEATGKVEVQGMEIPITSSGTTTITVTAG
jgi:hypothetical protein